MARNPGIWTILERGLTLTVALLMAAAGQPRQVAAQVQLPQAPVVKGTADVPEDALDADLAENVFLPPDRQTLKKLADARNFLSQGRMGEAVRSLGEILDGREDFFFQPDRKSTLHRSLKAEAQRLIGELPREGRELYELQYGAAAQRMLDDAVAAGDGELLAQVSRQYFHTRAGYQATFLLGLQQFDLGRPLAGALTLQRLQELGEAAAELEPSLSLNAAACWLRAGMPEKAQAALVSLRKRYPNLRLSVAGREMPLFNSDDNAVDWLANLIGAHQDGGTTATNNWLLFRGDAARNAISSGGAPMLNVRWQVPVADDPVVESALEQFKQVRAEQQAPVLTSAYPLAVDNVLLMRTARNLLAVDLTTGKRLWQSADDLFGPPAEAMSGDDMQMLQSMLLAGVSQRLWHDMTYGTISSDGSRVFVVEDLDVGIGPGGVFMFRRGGQNVVPLRQVDGQQNTLCNRLAAYDVRTGALCWQIGGPAGPGALPQAETFFLGPPLPLMGQLYVLGEIKGEIRLLALNAANGTPLWFQQLAVVEQTAPTDPTRRWSGVSPSYAEGVLVCPTAAGAVVGVELATRSLLWGYRYAQGRSKNTPPFALSIDSASQLLQRWVDSSATIVEDRVLITPAESDSIYCLSLLDGALLWKRARQDALYVACADRSKVVLVGRRSVCALRTADGKPAWEGGPLELPAQSMPSGRGFRTGDQYFLPLSSAEVATIDLESGLIVQRTKSRKGLVPGNLICHRGMVISQNPDGTQTFWQLDVVRAEVERRLAVNPADAEALSLRGEMLLETAHRDEAVAVLREAFRLAPSPRTRQLLCDGLLDSLREAFAAHAPDAAELEHLLDAPLQQATFLRLMAEGWRHAGRPEQALPYCLRLIDRQDGDWPLDVIDQNHSVRRDRWFRMQVDQLHAEKTVSAALAETVRQRWETARAARNIDSLRKFLDCFGRLPDATVAREELVSRLHSADLLLEAELTASAGLDAGQRAAVLKTQVLARREKIRTDSPWPAGKIEVAKIKTKNPTGNNFGRHVLPIRGNAEPFLADTTVYFDDGRQTISGSNSLGNLSWQISLTAEGQRQNFAYNRAISHTRASGHLLVAVLGSKIMAIDTLGAGRRGDARLLWTQDFTTSGYDDFGLRQFGLGNLPWHWRHAIQPYDQTNVLGPVTSRYVCYQRQRSLVAVEPYTGKQLWVRHDVPPGSDLFGDEEHLLVLSPNREDAMLLRADDGGMLGTRRIPRINARQSRQDSGEATGFLRLEDYCLAVLGRRLLLWWPEGDQRTLTLIDPVEGRDEWPSRSFSAAAHCDVVGNQTVGIFEPSGRFVLIDLADGRTIADVQLPAEPSLIDITLLADGTRYYLLTRCSPDAGNPPAAIQPMPSSDPKPIYHGRLYALDDQGKLLWPSPAVVDNQFLLLDQPQRLPILTFATQVYHQKVNGEGRLKMSLLAIDKRNGTVAYKGEFINHAGVLNIVGDPEQKTVDLVMQTDTIRLTFTDQPLPPQPEKTRDPTRLPSGGQALWDSLHKIFNRMIEAPAKDEK